MSISSDTNPFRALLEALPKPRRFIADVVAVGTDGTLVVELPGGGQLSVRGEADLGDTVFVRDDLVEGVTESLPYSTIEV